MSFGIQKLYKIGSYQSACEKILPQFLNETCQRDVKRVDPIWGCCLNLCKNNSECYEDAEALRWGTDGMNK
jgi:hypothetical protein